MIRVNTQTDELAREQVPAGLKKLADETLRNLQTELDPVPSEYLNYEWWPEVNNAPPLAADEKYGSEILNIDKPNKQVLVSYNVETKTQDEIDAEIETSRVHIQSQIQQRLDSFAQSRMYDSALSCCSYSASTDPTFNAEANYMLTARESTWTASRTIYDDVVAGNRAIPNDISEIEGELPTLAWP